MAKVEAEAEAEGVAAVEAGTQMLAAAARLVAVLLLQYQPRLQERKPRPVVPTAKQPAPADEAYLIGDVDGDGDEADNLHAASHKQHTFFGLFGGGGVLESTHGDNRYSQR